MKKLLKIFTALVLGVTLLQAAAFEKTAKGGGTEIMISSDKPLTPGNNKLLITIKDTKYKDAKVSVKVFMPEMPGMPRMEAEADATAMGDGMYDADLNFSMSGTWQVWVYIAPTDGKKVRIKTSLNI
ncbi:FixH family protein [Sulfurimonas sp. HSL3-2]|uniref:FixH family protein n=1 Tax=Hydrocurvibacter mobilis TaxID=3131936 RepID=UPI0031F7A489